VQRSTGHLAQTEDWYDLHGQLLGLHLCSWLLFTLGCSGQREAPGRRSGPVSASPRRSCIVTVSMFVSVQGECDTCFGSCVFLLFPTEDCHPALKHAHVLLPQHTWSHCRFTLSCHLPLSWSPHRRMCPGDIFMDISASMLCGIAGM
jgi:hypothetical protein